MASVRKLRSAQNHIIQPSGHLVPTRVDDFRAQHMSLTHIRESGWRRLHADIRALRAVQQSQYRFIVTAVKTADRHHGTIIDVGAI